MKFINYTLILYTAVDFMLYIVDKTVTYASETWILTKRDRKQTFLKEKYIEEF